MARHRHAFVLGIILIAFAAGAAHSAEPTPLPSNLKIVLPDSTIPPEVTAFSGKWVGKWEEKLDSTLVVYKIHPANPKGGYKAEVIYSWGMYTPWYILTPGHSDLDGEIKDGRLVIVSGRLNLQYEMSADRIMLTGAYRAGRGTYPGVFKKVSE